MMSILLGFDEKSSHTRRGKSSKKSHSSSRGGGKHEDLLVFGYHCKLFRDDSTAEEVNKGNHLIPWMGNADLMIDRFVFVNDIYIILHAVKVHIQGLGTARSAPRDADQVSLS